MPIYQYQCESCGSLWEEIRNLAQHDSHFACEQCNSRCARNQFPTMSVVLKYTQKETGRQEQEAQSTEGSIAVSIEGPTRATFDHCEFSGVSRGIVAHPQAQIALKQSRFHNVKVPVERRKK